MLRVSILVFKHAKLGDDVDVVRLGQGLQCSLEDCFWLGVIVFAAHFEEEFDVAGPDLETLEILFA